MQNDARDFGQLIVRRRGSVWTAVKFVFLATMGVLLTTVTAFHATGAQLWLVPLFGLGTASFSYAAWTCTRHALTVATVCEHGVTQFGPAGETAIAYADATSFAYRVTRQYTNFIYQGTDVEFSVADDEGGRVHLSAKYHERRLATGTFRAEFVDEDQLDQLRTRITTAIADRMLARLKAGGAVRLGKHVEATSAGVALLSGRTGVIPWDRLLVAHMEDGTLRVLYETEKEPSGGQFPIFMSDENAWPFYALMLALAPHVAPSGPASGGSE